MKWKKETEVVEKALEIEIKERVRQLSAQNPNGFGSLSMMNINSNPNRFNEPIKSLSQQMGSYNYSAPMQLNYNAGFMDKPRAIWSQGPLYF